MKDIFQTTDEAGILILYKDLGKIDGFAHIAYGQKFIHINSNLSEAAQKIICARELDRLTKMSADKK